jgi:hypothetical protein
MLNLVTGNDKQATFEACRNRQPGGRRSKKRIKKGGPKRTAVLGLE